MRAFVDLDLLADAPDDDRARAADCVSGVDAPPSTLWPEPGIGLPCGHVAGSPSSSTSFSSTSAEIACSQRSASLWTFSHSRPITSTSSRSARRWRRTIDVATSRPLAVSRRRAVVEQLGVAVVDEAVHGLRDGRRREAEALDQARPDRDRAFFLDLEDGFEVLLGGVVPLGHRHSCFAGRATLLRHLRNNVGPVREVVERAEVAARPGAVWRIAREVPDGEAEPAARVDTEHEPRELAWTSLLSLADDGVDACSGGSGWRRTGREPRWSTESGCRATSSRPKPPRFAGDWSRGSRA